MATSEEKIKHLHSGFDTLEVSFKVRPNFQPAYESFLQELDRAKVAAQREDRPINLSMPGWGQLIQVGKSGMAGGYAYTLDTGEVGFLVWLKNSSKEEWNARIKVRSAYLMLYGYEKAKNEMLRFLKMCGLEVLTESIARADFCVDMLAPGFKPDARHVVCHSRSTVGQRMQLDEKIRGRQVESVTIGKMPGRQICIYDKSKEVKARGKDYWWDKWDIEEQPGVWRFEIRAGKNALKDYGLKDFDNFEKNFQDYVAMCLRNVRLHTVEQTNKTVTRQRIHNIWQMVAEQARAWKGWLADVSDYLEKRVSKVRRDHMQVILHKQIKGCMISQAALHNVTLGNIADFLRQMGAEIASTVLKSDCNVKRKLKDAQQRYAFLIEKPKEEIIYDTDRENARINWGHFMRGLSRVA